MNEKIATRPRVVESEKGWYLYFLVRNPATGKMVARKIEKGFKKCISIEEKREWGRKLVAEYSKKLNKGWTPWSNDESIYEDQVQYKNVSQSFGYKRKARGTVRKHASEFLSYKKPGLKSKTFATYQSKLRKFTQWIEMNGFGEYDISAIDNKIILRFFDYLISERELDKVTIKGYKIKISAFFDFLIKSKRLLQNPVYDIPELRKKCDNAPKPILQDDLGRLLKPIKNDDPQLYLACMFQFFCAIRPGNELRLLKIKHIDFWSKKITINILDSKIERTDVIDIPLQLYELMTKVYHLQNYNKEYYIFSKNGMPGEKPLGMNTMRNRFNKFRDSLGLSKDYKYYSLKHTGAGMLLDSGVSLKDLMDHLRHHDIESTYHYIRKYKGTTSEKIRNHFPSPYEGFNTISE